MAKVIGSTYEVNARKPITGTRTWMISSLAYAVDDKASLANTASAVGLPSRSCSSWSVLSGGPRTLFLNRYDRLSGSSMPGPGGRGVGGGALAVRCSVDRSGSVTVMRDDRVANPRRHRVELCPISAVS